MKEKTETVTSSEIGWEINVEHNGLRDWIFMFTELRSYRELMWQMFLRDFRLRYKQAVMGIIWAVFLPLMVVFSGSVLKFVMATVSGQPLELVSFANMSIKAVAWSFFIGILTNGANSLLGNINLITKIYFPREVFPISATLTQLFDTIVGSTLLFALLVWVGVIQWTLNLFWIPLLAILLLFMALAISMFLSCTMVFYRDVKYILNIFTSFGIFFSPVFFETSQLGPRLGPAMMLNPVAPLLEGFRLAIIEGHNLLYPLYNAQNVLVWHPGFLLYSALLAIFGLLFAWRYFHIKEKLYAEFI